MFYYNGNNFKIQKCVELANTLVRNEESIYTVVKNKSFDMSTATGKHIAQQLKDSLVNEKTIEIVIYKPFYRWSKALGYFDRTQPNKIFLNYYRLNRAPSSIVATIIHEWVHFVDGNDDQHSFGHGDNNRLGKENTAPYFIGNLASKLISGNSNYNNTENQAIKTYTPFYKKVFRFFKRIF
tara:strand:+ start:34171 stop:34713 length:543 start_codon:yes stop_codon:yes gene_type:complete